MSARNLSPQLLNIYGSDRTEIFDGAAKRRFMQIVKMPRTELL